jgi:outer membrane protein assembly factor BamA
MIDRLYLGGPTDLRSFGQYGAGPSEYGVCVCACVCVCVSIHSGCSLGGSALWAWALHLYRPLIPRGVLYAHAFLTAGNLMPVGSGEGGGLMRQLHEATTGVRCSAGLG